MSDVPAAREGFIVMRHPEIPGGYGEATPEGFALLWEGKGWVAVTDEDRTRSLSGLSKSDLVAEAERRGLDPSGTAADIRSRLTESKES